MLTSDLTSQLNCKVGLDTKIFIHGWSGLGEIMDGLIAAVIGAFTC